MDARWNHFWKQDALVDDMWEIMYNIFVDALNTLCAMINRYMQVNIPNWVTKEVRESIKEKIICII